MVVHTSARRGLEKDGIRVSIVMPSFNQAAYIEEAIRSVLDQDYDDLELIVVDGGSTDGTHAILDRYRARLASCISEPDRGQSDALNKGFAVASGNVFGWLNSDDRYAQGAIRTAVEVLRSNPKKSVVFGDWMEIDARGNAIQRQYAFDFNLSHFIYEGFHINAQSMFWRADAHAAFGTFDVGLHRTMDYQLILLLGQRLGATAFVRVPQVLGCFRRHAEQKTSPGDSGIVQDEHRRMAATYGYTSKYRWSGRVIRLVYRVRRGWWYAYRGGSGYLARQLLRWIGWGHRAQYGS
jgi:glycosyltransferase involved in cell wall biosynthesis